MNVLELVPIEREEDLKLVDSKRANITASYTGYDSNEILNIFTHESARDDESVFHG